MKKITLGLADPYPIAVLGIAQVLADQHNLEIAFGCSKISDLLSHLLDTPVDVLLCDLQFPEDPQLGTPQLLRQIRRAAPHTKILILSSHCHAHLVSAALSAGAMGFVSKSHDVHACLPHAVQHVHNGNVYLPASLTSAVLRDVFQEPNPSYGLDALSEREQIVAHLHSDGLKTSEIAARLHLMPSTVSKYKHAAMRKLGAHSDVELAHIVHSLQALSP